MIIPRVSQANFNRMLQEPGKHSLGGGLMLLVRAPGKASYSMRFQRQEGRGESWDWGRHLQSLSAWRAFARARGWTNGVENPARWVDLLQMTLPKPSAIHRERNQT